MKLIAYDVIDFEEKVLEQVREELGVELILEHRSLTPETLALAEGCEGVSVIGYSRVTRNILEGLKSMGIFQLSTRTVGFDHIDVKAAKELGIHVSNARYEPYNVADFTVMMMLILLRKAKISICRALVNDFSLDGLKGRELRSLTVGIIGTGRIGSTVIHNLSGFGCRILACDSYMNPAIRDMAEYVDLDTIYREADIISLHVPMTEENYHMINKDSIAKMKDGVILINTARGALINSEDLIDALEKEKIGGAGIDTVEDEEGIVHVHVGTNIVVKRSLLYLKQFPNVVFTQHYAFFTEEASESMVRCGIQSIYNGASGMENPFEIK